MKTFLFICSAASCTFIINEGINHIGVFFIVLFAMASSYVITSEL